jgi:hypothetical protein
MTYPHGKRLVLAVLVFAGIILSPVLCQHSAYG